MTNINDGRWFDIQVSAFVDGIFFFGIIPVIIGIILIELDEMKEASKIEKEKSIEW